MKKIIISFLICILFIFLVPVSLLADTTTDTSSSSTTEELRSLRTELTTLLKEIRNKLNSINKKIDNSDKENDTTGDSRKKETANDTALANLLRMLLGNKNNQTGQASPARRVPQAQQIPQARQVQTSLPQAGQANQVNQANQVKPQAQATGAGIGASVEYGATVTDKYNCRVEKTQTIKINKNSKDVDVLVPVSSGNGYQVFEFSGGLEESKAATISASVQRTFLKLVALVSSLGSASQASSAKPNIKKAIFIDSLSTKGRPFYADDTGKTKKGYGYVGPDGVSYKHVGQSMVMNETAIKKDFGSEGSNSAVQLEALRQKIEIGYDSIKTGDKIIISFKNTKTAVKCKKSVYDPTVGKQVAGEEIEVFVIEKVSKVDETPTKNTSSEGSPLSPEVAPKLELPAPSSLSESSVSGEDDDVSDDKTVNSESSYLSGPIKDKYLALNSTQRASVDGVVGLGIEAGDIVDISKDFWGTAVVNVPKEAISDVGGRTNENEWGFRKGDYTFVYTNARGDRTSKNAADWTNVGIWK